MDARLVELSGVLLQRDPDPDPDDTVVDPATWTRAGLPGAPDASPR